QRNERVLGVSMPSLLISCVSSPRKHMKVGCIIFLLLIQPPIAILNNSMHEPKASALPQFLIFNF
ncbi:MAG: hypothetical protein R3Y32_09380, partial [Bacillota bacterium]